MDYFIIIDNKRLGPLKKEELNNRGITPATMVWREGLTDWQAASELEELIEILSAPTPPPMPDDRKPVAEPPAFNPKAPSDPASEPDKKSGPDVPPPSPFEPKAKKRVAPLTPNLYKININGVEYGPMPKWELPMANVTPLTGVLEPGATQWKALSEVPELLAFYNNEPVEGAEEPVQYIVTFRAPGTIFLVSGTIRLYEDYICISPMRPQKAIASVFSKSSKSVKQHYGYEEIEGIIAGFGINRYILLRGDRKVLFGAVNGNLLQDIYVHRQEYYKMRGIEPPVLKELKI